MKYSLIIPVFNRPDEVDELLESLTRQTLGRQQFEVVIVEDGSEVRCEDVVGRYSDRLDVRYFEKPNSGPGQSRNYGAERSRGEYLIVLDSDVVLPEGYLAAVDKELTDRPCEAFGGPDRAHESFTPVQKAINYSMTSFFTTGGIRGGKKKLDKFYPRSFNMGIRSDLYRQLGGFSNMRFGEDIDFSIRIFKSGARCRLFPEAWVWHKRRTDFRKFFRQVHNSGIARINLYKKYPDSLKLVHLLPAFFTVGVVLLALLFFVGLVLAVLGLVAGRSAQGCNMGMVVVFAGLILMAFALAPLLLYSLIILIDSSVQNRSLRVGLLSVPASFIQLVGYGTGFLRAWWLRCICGRNEELQAFRKTFYK
ncbi:MAG: glycosyltransferase [Bacteroidaceae bacterium]|nr:glycosyltransferase [Bacteroidaceae bacterium]